LLYHTWDVLVDTIKALLETQESENSDQQNSDDDYRAQPAFEPSVIGLLIANA